MQGTFTIEGYKVRCQSQRRFILVQVYGGRANIEKRSDSLGTLQAYRANHGGTIVDTATGEQS
jgi:hypothetical protein